jgi:hypothetical protein
MIDLSKLELNTPVRDRETDPIKIFNSLTLRGGIEGLFGPQQEALSKWHECRSDSDVLFSLNTGGGKTLVGLLAAQSLVNETRGKVLYVCPTNQLVQQTAAMAADCGIRVATYAKQKWCDKAMFDSCQSCGVTNYHAVFHGFSKFASMGIRGIIFDDAHVAPSIVRECFSLTISTKHSAWGKLMALFRDYFGSSSFAARFNRFAAPSGKFESGVLFVPGWFIFKRRSDIIEALEQGGVAEDQAPQVGETKYAYAHLRDHIAQCAFFISQSKIEITPSALPTHKLPYFRQGVRRIFMTATLPSRYESIRTFGLDKAKVIAPAGKAGAAQRLFIFAHGQEGEDAYKETRRLASSRKAVIITPSESAAGKWNDYAKLYDSNVGHDAILAFKNETEPKKIILAALYDGIDLPGKSCNVLILDGLPRGASLHDQFLEGSLDICSFRAANIAGRTTQSIGRIFRSNTDHGVVILADKAQQSWLISPENLAFIPALLQQQIRLGFALKALVENGKLNYPELVDAVIGGSNDWDKFYTREITKLEAEHKPVERQWGDQAGRAECDAFREMWEGRFEAATRILTDLVTKVEQHDPAHAAWYLHWIGVALLHAGQADNANAFFWQASNKKLSLGRPPVTFEEELAKKVTSAGPQALRVSNLLDGDYSGSVTSALNGLKGGGGQNADTHEESLKLLGERLGFLGSRPDSESGKGPDVVWELPEAKIVVAIEAKTQKESPKVYKKNKHIGKVLNDCIWLDENYKGYRRRLLLVGPHCGIAPQASPPPDLRVVSISEFIALAERLSNAAQNIFARIDSAKAKALAVESAFSFYGLLWPDCLDGMEYCLATDLQAEAEVDE